MVVMILFTVSGVLWTVLQMLFWLQGDVQLDFKARRWFLGACFILANDGEHGRHSTIPAKHQHIITVSMLMLAFSFKINFTPKQFTLTESLAKLETPKHVYFCYEFINLGILRVYAEFFLLSEKLIIWQTAKKTLTTIKVCPQLRISQAGICANVPWINQHERKKCVLFHLKAQLCNSIRTRCR